MSKFFSFLNKHYFVSVFGVLGIMYLFFPGWRLGEGESLGELHIVGAILLVGAVILHYMPDNKN